MPRGGRRKGAGRPGTGRTTKVIRVDQNFPNHHNILDIQEVVQKYYQELKSDPKKEKLVRWAKLKQLLQEIEQIDPDFLKQ